MEEEETGGMEQQQQGILEVIHSQRRREERSLHPTIGFLQYPTTGFFVEYAQQQESLNTEQQQQQQQQQEKEEEEEEETQRKISILYDHLQLRYTSLVGLEAVEREREEQPGDDLVLSPSALPQHLLFFGVCSIREQT
ncbi:unnamed protein product [Sphagnum compactum]